MPRVSFDIPITNITTPKKITIQADPEIQASLGKIDVSLTDYFSVEKIQEMLGENQDISIYDYKHNENDETMRFLLHKDFAVEIPGLNIEKELNSLTDLESLSFGYEEDGITPATLFSILLLWILHWRLPFSLDSDESSEM